MDATTGLPDTSHATFTVKVQDLSKRFNREWIFRDLDYEFRSGFTYAITGPNGSGKSTLLQVLWGQTPQTSGTIEYRKNDAIVSVTDVFRHVAIATPYMDLIEEFTLREMLKFHFGLRELRQGVSLQMLPGILYLEDALDKQLANFSSGMRQRLKLGLAFYTAADVYFLDEPGTNLDKHAFSWYRTQLAGLPANALVIVASNDPNEYPAEALNLSVMDYKKRHRA